MKAKPVFMFLQRASLHRQTGVAVIMALLLMALATTIVAGLFWQQQVQIRSIENHRLQVQKESMKRTLVDWACLILREDGKQSDVDYLSETWAKPLAETKLYQIAGAGSVGQDFEGNVLSGTIVDAQSRYNLSNLVKNGKIDATELATFSRLLTILHLDAGLAQPIAKAVFTSQAAANRAPGEAATPLNMPLQYIYDLLAVPGVTPAVINELQDFVVVLPEVSSVNLNTASTQVLTARMASLSTAQVAALIDSRAQHYFSSIADFQNKLSAITPIQVATDSLSVSTHYFLMKGKIRMGRAALDFFALIERSGQGENSAAKVLWSRES